MKIKKWLHLCIAALFMLNITVTICGASEKISPDIIKFQGMG